MAQITHALKRDQYQGNYLVNVARKGESRSKGLYMVAGCRRQIDSYLETARHRDDPTGDALLLFLQTRKGRIMIRQLVFRVLNHIAEEASKQQKKAVKGAEYRDKTGSDTETAAALGHAGLRYVGRYVRKSRDERETALERCLRGDEWGLNWIGAGSVKDWAVS